MKRRLSIFLTVILCMNIYSCIIGYAQDNLIAINSVSVSLDRGEVSITGRLTQSMGWRDVAFTAVERGTDLEELFVNPEKLCGVGQTETEYNGNFKYTLDINPKNDNDIQAYDIHVSAYGNETIIPVEMISRGAWDNILENSVILQQGNKITSVYSEVMKADNPPVKNEQGIFIDASVAKKISDNLKTTTVNGKQLVNINQLTAKKIYTDNDIIIISDVEISGTLGIMRKALGFYVSQNGNDNNDGSYMSPVKSIERAAELAQEALYSDKEKYIWLLEEEYKLEKTISISDKQGITIQPFGEKAHLNAELKLNKDDFEKAEGDILSAVSPSARNSLVQLDLSKYLDDVVPLRELSKTANGYGVYGYYRLYENEEEQQLSRYPNADFTTAQKAGETISEGYVLSGKNNAAQWKYDTENIMISGFLRVTYYCFQYPLDMGANGVFFPQDATNILSSRDISNTRFTIYNVPEEIDIPGEWYIDADKKMLYYYPSGSLENVTLTIFNDTAVKIDNSSDIKINDIEISGSNGVGINVTDSRNVTLDNLKLHALGSNAVTMTKCTDTKICNSEIYDIVGGGVDIDCGEKVTLISGNCGVENCHIYSFAEERTNKPAVYLKGIGNYARNNVMYDSMSQGVFFSGNDLVIENNEIFDVMRNVYDGGAVYGSTQHERLGNKVTQNYVHHLTKLYGNYGSGIYAFYMDDMSNGIDLSKNIVTDANNAGLFGGGRDNIIKNNVFIDTKIGNYDTRGIFGGAMRQNRGGTFTIDMLSDPLYDEEKWKAHYPVIWERLLGDYYAEKEYLEAKEEAEANGEECTVAEFDFGIPRNVEVKNNLVISRRKRINLNPVSLAWQPQKYQTVYEDNLSVMKQTNQDSSISDKYNHNKGNSLRYEILDISNTALKREIGEKAAMGEMYRISAWIYAEKINQTATALLEVDNNPQRTYLEHHYDYYISGSGETALTQGEWTEIFGYWIANDNKNSIVISFPKCSKGDVFYIDDIQLEKVYYSDIDLPSPNINRNSEGVYSYQPDKLDLSQTNQLIKVGQSSTVVANLITASRSDKNGDGYISSEEVTFTTSPASNLTISSSNTSVAQISGNTIVAKAPGYAIITARSGTTTEKLFVTCYNDGSEGTEFNGASGLVKDNDPIYNTETIRSNDITTSDMNIKPKAGTIINFWYYDSGLRSKTFETTDEGVTANNNNAELFVGWTFGDDASAYLYHSDRYFEGKVRINTWQIGQRRAGWHQISAVCYESSGELCADFYYNANKVGTLKGLDPEETIKFYVRESTAWNFYPLHLKNIYAVGTGKGTFSPKAEITGSTVFDDFEESTFKWKTSNADLLNSVYDGVTAIIDNNYDAWFNDIETSDLEITDEGYSEIRSYMPDFEEIDFNAIGNTQLFEVKANAPKLKYPSGKIETNEISFVWSDTIGSSEYLLSISKNEDMSEPVYTNKVNTNTDTVTIKGTGRYYYTVTAINLAKQYSWEKTSRTGSFYIVPKDGKLTLNRVDISQKDEKTNIAAFVYDCTNVTELEGVVLLAQKNAEGRLIGVQTSDIPQIQNSQLTVTGEYIKGNTLECYIWSDTDALIPYTQKAETTK